MFEKGQNATGGVIALPFLSAESAATPRSTATALVAFRQLDCYDSNPTTSGWRPTRNNCVSRFAELDGLYISCQPQRFSCFFLPFLPIMWHSQVNRLSGCTKLRFQCPISGPTLTVCFLDVHTFIVSTPDLYIAVWSNSLLLVACNSAVSFTQQQQTPGEKSRPAWHIYSSFWQTKRVIHYILTVLKMFWGCLFFSQQTTLKAIFNALWVRSKGPCLCVDDKYWCLMLHFLWNEMGFNRLSDAATLFCQQGQSD